jgi:hypothetical protein
MRVLRALRPLVAAERIPVLVRGLRERMASPGERDMKARLLRWSLAWACAAGAIRLAADDYRDEIRFARESQRAELQQ